MAGIVSGISHLAVGQRDARRPTKTLTPSEDKHVLINDCNAHLADGPCDARHQQTQTQTQSIANPTKTTTPTTSQDKHLDTYCNAGEQYIKGLTNQTGYVKGNANGVINFGELTASDNAQREE